MHKLAVATMVACAALLSGALAADQPGGMDAKRIIQKVHRGVITVHVSDVRSPMHDIDWGGGSGFIFEIDYDKGIAYAITNHHVAGHASFVSISTWNGTNYNGELVRSAPGIDIALIKLHGIPDERNLPDDQKTIIPVVLGDSDKVQVGELGLAMGSPGSQDVTGAIGGTNRSNPYNDFLMSQTATLNVVTGRYTPLEFELEVWADGRNGGGDESEVMGYQYGTDLDYAFRMSTAINGGNSGGPLFNKYGEVIAINTWGQVGTLHQNGNLSVPINLAKDFVYQVLNTGKFERPWVGIDILFPPTVMSMSATNGHVDPLQAYQEFLDHRPDRLEVYGVRKSSPADFVGMKKGDVILDVNGKKFKTPEELRHWVFTQDIGTNLSFLVMRDGKVLKDRIKVNVGPKRTYDAEFSV